MAATAMNLVESGTVDEGEGGGWVTGLQGVARADSNVGGCPATTAARRGPPKYAQSSLLGLNFVQMIAF